MIIPISIDDQDIEILHKKVNRKVSNVSSADVRKKISELVEEYVQYSVLEEVYEDMVGL